MASLNMALGLAATKSRVFVTKASKSDRGARRRRRVCLTGSWQACRRTSCSRPTPSSRGRRMIRAPARPPRLPAPAPCLSPTRRNSAASAAFSPRIKENLRK
ncbi:uncharacterized protein M6B38_321240 [Iris pallida]|uniref:Uncharacterized protein n=1 Tax=Iris pallida TaxID=29817 RepID=A0AAX6HBX9_IRIPA|nr:uncharacterized protein M6B38_321240 [Iris pallida]